ncbi:MAG TPA: hypothetical protein VF421_18535 [Niabella sp.]
MPVIDQLASSRGKKDEIPNIELANQLIANPDQALIKELIENLSNKSKAIQHDCMKTLYEIAARAPALVAAYTDNFIHLLESNDNRMQWGAMTALNHLTGKKPQKIYSALARLAAVASKGSVITRDHYVAILTKLCTVTAFAADAFDLLNEQLVTCPANQLPLYAENALPVISSKYRTIFVRTLSLRLNDFEKESKRKRLEKVLQKLHTQ